MRDRLRILFWFVFVRYRRPFPSRAALEAWQHRRLARHLRYVIPRSPFYRDRLHGGWSKMKPIGKTETMTNFDELNTKGLTGREVVRTALDAEHSRDFAPMIGDVTVGLSSGTSGHRGVFCADRGERLRYAGTILAKALPRGGLVRRHRVAFFLRANSNLYESTGSSRLSFAYFDLLQPLGPHLDRMRTFDPTLIIAPPSLLREMARAILDGTFAPGRIDRIFSVAEVLDPTDEAFIARAFGQKVHQIYQCTEGFLGLTCAHGSLHLNEDLAIIEKDWIEERAFKFAPVITDLYRRTQPVIRYRLNDILTEDPTPCPCGSVMTRLKMIEGRQDDMIDFPTAEGWRAVFPDFVRNAILYAAADIEEYTVTQEPDRRLTVSLKVRDDATSTAEDRVRASFTALAARLGCRTPTIDFDHRDVREPGVKLRRVRRRPAAAHLPS